MAADPTEHPADYAAREAPVVPARDHFTEAEMRVLVELPSLSLRDRLVLRIMAETGLRRRAVSWLLVDGVFDRAVNSALTVCRALEKGLVMRAFSLSQATRALLERYVREGHPGAHVRWLFPSPKAAHTLPVTPAVINSILPGTDRAVRGALRRTMRACRQAGVTGRHTHTHAVRKFVVCRLMEARNRIEDALGPARTKKKGRPRDPGRPSQNG